MIEELQTLMDLPAYQVGQTKKSQLMLSGLNALSSLHYENCPPYRDILNGYWGGLNAYTSLEQLPYLPVSLFKTHALRSIESEDIRMTLTSSGTTGQAVSQIFVDKNTSSYQQRALAKTLQHVLGAKRLPMLVLDTDAVFKNPKMMSARGAGVMGLMRYGHHHAFAMDPNLEPEFEVVKAFLKTYGDEPFFMFGFTFLVWSRFYKAFEKEGLDLRNGILIHSGGWKKMIDDAVDNSVFRKRFSENFNLDKIYNFYGMVEQIGSLFLEGPEGRLYAPNISDVIIRDPISWEVQPHGKAGLIQVLSLLPHSYPGHSLLTEDMGVVEDVDTGLSSHDNNIWMGKGIKVLGRVKKAELRGCSDVVASNEKVKANS